MTHTISIVGTIPLREGPSGHSSRRAFVAASMVLFAMSVALTIISCGPMSAMPGMPMPGGWTMSMAWMQMPAQSWLGAAGSFLGMWTVMMIAMMLPSFAPTLWRYRQALSRTASTRLNGLTALVALGYFSVWTALGAVIFPVGLVVATVEMESSLFSRAVPLMSGVVVLVAGLLQFTAWKSRHLTACQDVPGSGGGLAADPRAAWWHGLNLGVHCGQSCANLAAMLLVFGVMDLRMMALITLAITTERLGPIGQRAVHVGGSVIVAVGLFLIAQAVGALFNG